MKKSQLNPPPSGVFGTIAKLLRLIEKEGVEWSDWQHPTNDVTARRNLAEFLKMGCPNIKNDKELCRLILGNDFLSPEDVAILYGFEYSDKQNAKFAETLPDSKTLIWFRVNGYMLIATPPNDLNLLQIRTLDNKVFCSKTGGWYAKNNQKFAQNDTVKAGRWLAIRKEVVPNSFDKTWNCQRDLLAEVEYIPNIAEIGYSIATYFKQHKESLFTSEYAVTSSIDAANSRVCIGTLKNGINIKDYFDVCCHSKIGISSYYRALED